MRDLLLQSFPTRWQGVLETFRGVADERPFGYVVLDLRPASGGDRRVLGQLLGEEGFVRCHQFSS